jgi:hypothetical protein
MSSSSSSAAPQRAAPFFPGAGAGPSVPFPGGGAGGVGGGLGAPKRNAMGEEAGHAEYLDLTPLGAGCEVGRSCHMLRYKGKTIMLDCGILPSFTGLEALPLIQEVNPAEVDIIFIT